MAFWLLCRHGQSNSPPAGGEIPLRKEPSSGPMRASGPTKKRSIIAPSSAPFGGTCPYPLCRCATSPLDKGSRPPCRGKACGRPGVPPLRRGWKPSSHFVGAGHWPARIRGAPRSSRPTQKSVLSLPPHPPQCAHWGTFPPRGKACRRLIAAPTADIEAVPFSRRGRSGTGPTAYAPGALVRQTQAQMRNRTSGNFCNPRARWPGGNSDTHSDFRAPKIFCLVQGVTPVNGVRGKANMSAKRSS